MGGRPYEQEKAKRRVQLAHRRLECRAPRLDLLARNRITRACWESLNHGAKVPRSGLNPIDGHVGSRVRMRRLMLKMSQSDLADGLGLTFQQVQKYEKGTNRIGASRLQHISQILQVPVPFFLDGVTGQSAVEIGDSDLYVNQFLATSDGLAFVKAFTRIPNPKLRRAIVLLVQQITAEDA
jgi:transcriptional regulator with XRE-family HTH domain